MRNRLDLHKILCNILKSDNCYYSAPATIEMHYPCIRYELTEMYPSYANDNIYRLPRQYQIMLIDEDPDSVFVDKIMELQYCTFSRHYTAEGLNHFVFYLYY